MNLNQIFIYLLSLLMSAAMAIDGIIPENIKVISTWITSSPAEQYQLPMEYKAAAVGLDVTEFEFFARVVEMESNRSITDDFTTEGRVLIAIVIWNRMYSDVWPNTITNVLCQSGQFTTVSGGWCSCPYTDASQWAIVEAYRRIQQNEAPSVFFFNCIGYNRPGKEYDCVGGNYFMY